MSQTRRLAQSSYAIRKDPRLRGAAAKCTKRSFGFPHQNAHQINDHPNDPEVLNNLAWLYQQQGELATAREFAERAFTKSPGAAHIVDTLGWILLGQGQSNAALTYLSLANLSDPRSPVLQYHLAVALHRVGRSADARVLLEHLLGSNASFADKGEAEKLLQELTRG